LPIFPIRCWKIVIMWPRYYARRSMPTKHDHTPRLFWCYFTLSCLLCLAMSVYPPTLSCNVCLLCLAMSVYSVSQCLSVPGIPAVQWYAAVIMLSTLKIG
jgi:hypothetical protein